MAYTGVIIAGDLAGTSGFSEGCPGERPQFEICQFHKDGDDPLDVFARGLKHIAARISAPRSIGNRIYGPGEAVEEGMIRVALEAPIMNPMIGNTNAMSQLLTKGLWASIGGFAAGRGVMVRCVTVGQCRKHFIGNGGEKGEVGKRKARMMCEALGWNPPNLDCADAGAVWHWASAQWNPEMTPPVKHLHSKIASAF